MFKNFFVIKKYFNANINNKVLHNNTYNNTYYIV